MGLVHIGQFLVFVWYSDPLKEGRGGNLGKPSGPSQPFSYLLALLCWFWKRDQLEPVVNGVVYTDLAVSISAWICVDGPGCLVLWTIWGSSLASKIGLEINKTCVIFGTISWILFLEKRKVARCLRIEALRGEPLQESVLRFKHALLTAPVRLCCSTPLKTPSIAPQILPAALLHAVLRVVSPLSDEFFKQK